MKKSPSGQAVSEPFSAAKRPTGTVDRCVWSAPNAMFAPQVSRRRSKGHEERGCQSAQEIARYGVAVSFGFPSTGLTRVTRKSLAETRGFLSEREDLIANCFAFGQQPDEEPPPHEEEGQGLQSAHELVKSLEKQDCEIACRRDQ